MKRKRIIIVCIIISILLLVIARFLWDVKWLGVSEANFEEYSEEFNIVKDAILEIYPDEEYRTFMVMGGLSGGGLSEVGTGQKLEFNDEVDAAFNIIKTEGFPDQENGLDYVKVHNGKVIFYTNNGSYALSYWPDGRPTWACSPNQTGMVLVKEIGDGWYHVAQ